MTQPSKELIAALHDSDTIVIIPDNPGDKSLCTQWLDRNAPKVRSERRVFDELELASMQKGVSVIFMYHNPYAPLVVYEVDRSGAKIPVHRPQAELFDELVFTKPTTIGEKFWLQDNPLRPGKVDIPKLLEHFGKLLSPYRLDFVDKCAQRPTILRMKKV